MEYRSIDFVRFFSLILSGASALGVAALVFGPWRTGLEGQTAYAILSISSLAFCFISVMAGNVATILKTQADQIAALQRQLAG